MFYKTNEIKMYHLLKKLGHGYNKSTHDNHPGPDLCDWMMKHIHLPDTEIIELFKKEWPAPYHKHSKI